MLIIDRYLAREIVNPLFAVCAVLTVIFVSFSWARYLAKAVEGLIPMSTVLLIILLKAVIALEVLIPVALYFCVMLALGRLHSDSEMTALAASGMSPNRVVLNVSRIACVVAIGVALLSLFARPWAYDQIYWLKARAEALFNVSGLEPGRFYEKNDGELVIFVKEGADEKNRMGPIFVRSADGDTVRVISAQGAYVRENGEGSESNPVLVDGYEYRLSSDGKGDRLVRFHQLAIYPKEVSQEYQRKAASTAYLSGSDHPSDIAEFQWRLSTPISTILLGLLGIPLSRTAPRQGKYAKFLPAVVIYGVYYHLGALAKTWVEDGVVDPFPGIWWVPVILASLLVVFFVPPVRLWRWRLGDK